tara:strand:+ start:26630 stop:26944 length:315 start_codon:yes stop_codon:yes gene_type:complete
METDVDILDGEILREVQQSTLRIMQLLSKFIQWPTTQLILLDQIDEELDTIRELMDHTIPQDDVTLPALAEASDVLGFEQMAVATAWTGVKEMLDGFFGKQWRD